MRPKSDISEGRGLKLLSVDRWAGFAIYERCWYRLCLCMCGTKVRFGHSAHQWLEFLHSGWPWSPMCCQSWIIQHPQPLYFFPTLFLLLFLSTVSVCLLYKRQMHIINVRSHLAISWCTALGHRTTLFVSKCLREFGPERNDWFYKGLNQTVKSGANNTLETLWLH